MTDPTDAAALTAATTKVEADLTADDATIAADTATIAADTTEIAKLESEIPASPTPLTIVNTSTLPAATVETAYTAAFVASGGTAPYVWTDTGLPAGLTLSTAGSITGTPTSSGTFTVNVTVHDSATPEQSVTATFSLTVAPIVVTPPVTPSGPLAPFQVPYPFVAAPFAKRIVKRSPLPSSAQFVASMGKASFAGFNYMPLIRVPSSQPSVPLSGDTAQTGTSIPLPEGLTLNTSSDGPMVLWQQPEVADYEMWQVKANGSVGYSDSDGGKLTGLAGSSGVFPAPYGMSASGISYLATLFSQNDALAGVIDHALAMQASTIDTGFVPPAVRQDANTGSHPGYCHEGSWFAFPSSVSMPSGLAPAAQWVFTAIQTYGFVVTDQTQNSGYNMIQAEDPSEWKRQGNTGTDPITASLDGQANWAVLSKLPWSQLVLIATP